MSTAVTIHLEVSQVRNEIKTGGYGLLNLRSSYEWKQVRFDIGIENVLNKFYASPLGGAYAGQGMTMSTNGVPWGIPVLATGFFHPLRPAKSPQSVRDNTACAKPHR